MILPDKMKKLKDGLRERIYKNATEDSKDAIEVHETIDEDDTVIARNVKKGDQVLESSGAADAQKNGEYEKALKRVGVKEEDAVFTVPTMAAAKAFVDENDDEGRNTKEERDPLGEKMDLKQEVKEVKPKTKISTGKPDKSLSDMATEDSQLEESLEKSKRNRRLSLLKQVRSMIASQKRQKEKGASLLKADKKPALVTRKIPLTEHGHHTIPVAENLDWHLNNLWEGGWKTVKDMPIDEHIARHSGPKKMKKDDEDPEFNDRLHRLRNSFAKINSLMAELKRQQKTNQPRKTTGPAKASSKTQRTTPSEQLYSKGSEVKKRQSKNPIIGHTRSGKAIYRFGSKSHQKFNERDNFDAALAYKHVGDEQRSAQAAQLSGSWQGNNLSPNDVHILQSDIVGSLYKKVVKPRSSTQSVSGDIPNKKLQIVSSIFEKRNQTPSVGSAPKTKAPEFFDVAGRGQKAPDARSRDQKIKDALRSQSKTNPYAQGEGSVNPGFPSTTVKMKPKFTPPSRPKEPSEPKKKVELPPYMKVVKSDETKRNVLKFLDILKKLKGSAHPDYRPEPLDEGFKKKLADVTGDQRILNKSDSHVSHLYEMDQPDFYVGFPVHSGSPALKDDNLEKATCKGCAGCSSKDCGLSEAKAEAKAPKTQKVRILSNPKEILSHHEKDVKFVGEQIKDRMSKLKEGLKVSLENNNPTESGKHLVDKYGAKLVDGEPYLKNKMAAFNDIVGTVFDAHGDQFHPRLSGGNEKLTNESIIPWSLPPIFTCPGAQGCKGYCYAKSGPIAWDNALIKQWINYYSSKNPSFVDEMSELLSHLSNVQRANSKDWDKQVDTIQRNKGGKPIDIPVFADRLDEKGNPISYPWDTVRIHDAGDFYDPEYVQKWTEIAKKNPQLQFYAYSKSGHLAELKKYLDAFSSLKNTKLIHSVGGSEDHQISENKPHAVIFQNPEQIAAAGYQDAHNYDRVASDPTSIRLGLAVHGIHKNQFSFENHLRNAVQLHHLLQKFKSLGKAMKPTDTPKVHQKLQNLRSQSRGSDYSKDFKNRMEQVKSAYRLENRVLTPMEEERKVRSKYMGGKVMKSDKICNLLKMGKVSSNLDKAAEGSDHSPCAKCGGEVHEVQPGDKKSAICKKCGKLAHLGNKKSKNSREVHQPQNPYSPQKVFKSEKGPYPKELASKNIEAHMERRKDSPSKYPGGKDQAIAVGISQARRQEKEPLPKSDSVSRIGKVLSMGKGDPAPKSEKLQKPNAAAASIMNAFGSTGGTTPPPPPPPPSTDSGSYAGFANTVSSGLGKLMGKADGGRHPIGKTASGKPIHGYVVNKFDDHTKGYTPQDHMDAVAAHEKIAAVPGNRFATYGAMTHYMVARRKAGMPMSVSISSGKTPEGGYKLNYPQDHKEFLKKLSASKSESLDKHDMPHKPTLDAIIKPKAPTTQPKLDLDKYKNKMPKVTTKPLAAPVPPKASLGAVTAPKAPEPPKVAVNPETVKMPTVTTKPFAHNMPPKASMALLTALKARKK